jgi:hypothetical protein
MSAASLTRWARLSFRLQRWEVLASVLGVAVLAGLMLWFAGQLRFLAASEPGCADPAAYVPGCEAFVQRFAELSDWGSKLLYFSWGAPFGIGLLLGVPIVAREAESGTAGIAWTLSRSRVRWLVVRVVFAALLMIVLLVAVVLVSGALAAALLPQLHLDRDFTWYGRRDWLIVARGLAALGVGVLVGAAVGRVLPGLLSAAFVAILVFAGVSQGMDRWNLTLAQTLPTAFDDREWEERQGALRLGQRIELEGGEMVSWDYVASLGTSQLVDADGAIYTRFDAVTGKPDPSSFVGWDRELLVPGERYPEVLLRESVAVGAVALMLVTAAAAVVRRRRPA